MISSNIQTKLSAAQIRVVDVATASSAAVASLASTTSLSVGNVCSVARGCAERRGGEDEAHAEKTGSACNGPEILPLDSRRPVAATQMPRLARRPGAGTTASSAAVA